MQGVFTLEILTPDKRVFKGEVHKATVPGAKAPFVILASLPAVNALSRSSFEPAPEETMFPISAIDFCIVKAPPPMISSFMRRLRKESSGLGKKSNSGFMTRLHTNA